MRRTIHYFQGNNYKVYEGIMHPLSQIYWHQLQVFTNIGANCIHWKWILLRACAEEICQGGSISENHRLSNLNNCGKFHACIRNSTILALSRSAISEILENCQKKQRNRKLSYTYLSVYHFVNLRSNQIKVTSAYPKNIMPLKKLLAYHFSVYFIEISEQIK